MKTKDLHLFVHLRRALYAITFLAFVAFVVVFFFATQNQRNPIGAQVQVDDTYGVSQLPPVIQSKQTLFTVTNGSNFDWNDVRFTVNDIYVVEPGPILAGESKDVRLGDLKNFEEVPVILIPASRETSARNNISPQEGVTEQNMYTSLPSLESIKIRTNGGRILYDPKNQNYVRVDKTGQPTSVFQEIQNAVTHFNIPKM